eukprot:TRINITY_DN9992_c0_g1_i5.p1 TRINITY_DN9992_c0_g1~~TRINITY_DN9992_c0_g1_i5.p1  ORF type:complete len:356 (+),score=97.10 TRINITY_DN9992_c0_g1_i5:243-1310(+)
MSISVLLLWYGGTVVFDEPDILSVGKLITFELYWNKMNASYQQITSIWNSFTRAGGAAQRVMALLELVPDIDTGNGKILQDMRGDITLRDVEFWYQMRPDEKVLQGVNLDIPAGSVCALVGKSGSGKTTLISLILRLYDTKGGCILIDGEDIRNINPLSYRQHIGIVSQDTELFNGTVEANIAYGVNSYTKEDLINAAKEANAHEFIMGFEEGYQTRVGERGTRLSGGQKQRVALARVFLRKPKLMLLDEATSALDAESESLVQEAIDRLITNGGCTVILVAHRLSTVVNSDKICVVHKGRIVEQGTHSQLIMEGGIYSKLVSKQLSKMQNDLESKDKEGKSALDVIDTLIDETL